MNKVGTVIELKHIYTQAGYNPGAILLRRRLRWSIDVVFNDGQGHFLFGRRKNAWTLRGMIKGESDAFNTFWARVNA